LVFGGGVVVGCLASERGIVGSNVGGGGGGGGLRGFDAM